MTEESEGLIRTITRTLGVEVYIPYLLNSELSLKTRVHYPESGLLLIGQALYFI